MEYFSNINFNIFGENETLDSWLMADQSPVKKRRRNQRRERKRGEKTQGIREKWSKILSSNSGSSSRSGECLS